MELCTQIPIAPKVAVVLLMVFVNRKVIEVIATYMLNAIYFVSNSVNVLIK